jgi:hypothetical protein
MGRITTVAIGVLLFCAAVIHLQATTITVTNTNDSGPGSLRQALAIANDGDAINFTVTGTIALTSGELLVDKNVTISGPGSATLAVDGNFTSRVFHIGPGKSVSISGLTLTNGSAGSENGGGILNDHATLTLGSCAVQNSSAQSNRGGGIYNDGSAGSVALTIQNGTVSGNYAYSAGGGIYNDAENGGGAHKQHGRWQQLDSRPSLPWRRGGRHLQRQFRRQRGSNDPQQHRPRELYLFCWGRYLQ